MKNIIKPLIAISSFLILFIWSCSKEATPTVTPTPVVKKSSAKDITKFSFAALSPAVDATIDATAKTITATVPAATDLTKLVPTITISDKATVSPATGVATDFSKEVSYTVTAEDASTAVWKVNVVIEKPTVLNDIVIVGGGNDMVLYGLDAETGGKKWEFKGNGFQIHTAPAIVGNIAYFADNGGGVFGVDIKSGIQKWAFNDNSGLQTYEPPTIVNGVIYLTKHNDSSSSLEGSIYAIDIATSKLIWKFVAPKEGQISSLIVQSPAVTNGIVCFSSSNKNWYGLDAKTGAIKWQFKGSGGSSTTVANSVVYIGDYDNLYAKDAITGTTIWSFPINRFPGGLTVSDGILYASISGNNNYKISAIDVSTGKLKWEYKLQDASSTVSRVFKGVIYAVEYSSKKLFALDSKSGTKLWETLSAWPNRASGLTVANGLVYLTGDFDTKTIFAHNSKTGSVQWKFPFKSFGSSSGSTVIDKNGTVYYPSTSGMVQ